MIMSPKKTFCVYATTAREKIEWMTHISNCIDKLSSKNLYFIQIKIQWFIKSFNKFLDGRGLDRNLITAPKWIPDKVKIYL
jgi:hypothetical protein